MDMDINIRLFDIIGVTGIPGNRNGYKRMKYPFKSILILDPKQTLGETSVPKIDI